MSTPFQTPGTADSPGGSLAAGHAKLGFNADMAAIVIALALAALIRLNVIHHIGW